MKSWDKKSILKETIRWCRSENRWPVAVSSPVSESTIRRHFGSWLAFKEVLRTSYIRQHGPPEWERPVEKSGSQRKAILSEVATVVENAILNLNAIEPLKPKLKTHKGGKEEHNELHLVISDVHVGEKIELNLTAGISEYGFEQFEKSADILEERLLFFRELYSRAFGIKKLVINFIGDIVTGESIFLGQHLHIDRIVTEQVFEAARRFANIFRNWAPYFKDVEIICIPGNHGRIGRKGELSYLANFDFISYRVCEMLTRDVRNIKWLIAEGPSLVIRHGEYNWLIHHGDSIPGAGGAKGSFISLERKMEKFASMLDIPIHYSVSGHQHSAASVARNSANRIFQNGSWPGGSEFSIETMGAASIPSQKLLLFHPVKGIHTETDILLADRYKAREDLNRVYTRNYRTSG